MLPETDRDRLMRVARVAPPGPIGDYVLVLPPPQVTSVGGVALPQTTAEKPISGTVVEVGRGRFSEMGVRIPMEVVVGDFVEFSSYAGTGKAVLLSINGQPEEEYRLIRQDEIFYNHGPQPAIPQPDGHD